MKFKKAKQLNEQVADVIREKFIAKLQPHQRLPSEVELAREFSVSLVTVREALRSLAQDGLVWRRHGSGTFVAEKTTQPVVAIAGLLSASVRSVDFQMRLLRLLSLRLREHGLSSHIYLKPGPLNGEDWGDFYTEVAKGRVRGAAFVAMTPEPFEARLREKNVPYVSTSGLAGHGVCTGIPDLVRDGARHLLEQGCRRIAMMQGLSLPDDRVFAERSLDAFRAALADYGAAFEPRWVHQCVPPNEIGAGWEQFRAIWAADTVKPDGLLVADDILFRDVALGIGDVGVRVPDQLRVAAHANKGSGLGYPFPVTFLEIDPDEVADAMARKLVALIHGEPTPQVPHVVQARLVLADAATRSAVPSSIGGEPG